MADKKTKHILNLAGELNDFLVDFFSKEEFSLYERDQVENIEVLNYIIVSSVESAEDVAKEYDTLKNEIEVICYENSSNVREFLLSNGRLIINEKIKDNTLGNYVLSKFFSKFSSIHLDDSLPDQIDKIESFKLTNHLSAGHSIDEVSVHAFEAGFNLVPVRGFIDHAIYYFSYLKQAGLAGVPFEFEYGNNEEFFAVNIHASVKNFVAEYMIDSFGSVNSNDPLKYLLGVLGQNCDFLDLTYIENPGKVVITGFFSKNNLESLKGIAFNNILTSTQVLTQVEKKVAQYKPFIEKEEALLEKQNNLEGKNLPGGILDMISNLAEDSVLRDSELSDKITNFMVSQFENKYPDQSISEFSFKNFETFSLEFDPVDTIGKLSVDDKKHLVEKIQKMNLINAYNDEVTKVREGLKNDKNLVKELEDTISTDLASKVTEHIGVDLLNNILGKDSAGPEENSQVEESLFGEFTPSVPSNFEVDSAFDSIVPEFDSPHFDAASVVTDVQGLLSEVDSSQTIEDNTFDMDGFSETVPDFGDESLDGFMTIYDSGDEKPFSQSLSGGPKENQNSIKIGGGPDDPESATLVKGGKEEADDFVQKISGMPKDKDSDFVKSFSNSFDENSKDGKFLFKSSSTEERKKELKMFVKSTLDESPGLEAMDQKIKAFIHKEAPDRINAGLENYAKKLGLTLDELNEEQISTFKDTELPIILTDLVNDEDSIDEFKGELESFLSEDVTEVPMPGFDIVAPQTSISNFEATFKKNLEDKLSKMEEIAKSDDKYVLSENSLPEEKMHTLIQETMRESFEAEFKLSNASPEEISAKEAQLIKDLSSTLHMNEDDVRAIVKGASDLARDKEKQIVADKLYGEGDLDETKNFSADGSEENDYVQQTSSKAEATLISKLKEVEEENKKLKTGMSALQLQLSAGNDVKDKFEKIMAESEVSEKDVTVVSGINDPALNAVEKKQVISALKDGEPISSETAEKLQRSLEKENEIIELAKAAETQIKKFQLESEKKDALFKTELAKAQKAVSAKDMVLQKAKDSLRNFMAKKEKETVGLKGQVNELNQKLKNDQSTQLKTQVKNLNREKENLIRTADVYKNKLESMAKSMTSNKKEDNSTVLTEENRNLSRLKNQLENKLAAESKLKKSFEDRFQKAKEAETKARSEATNATNELKLVQGQIKTLKDQNTKLVQSAASSGNLSANKISKELDHVKGKNSKLQEKVSSLTKKLEEVSGAASSTTTQAKSSIDIDAISKNPLQAKAELLKSGKEVDLLKDQNQKLQNKIEELNGKYKDTHIRSLTPEVIKENLESREAHEEKQAKKELDLLKGQNEQLQGKIKELVGKMKKMDESKNSAPVDGGSAKEKRLEQSVKKMNMELTKARGEAAEKKKEAMKSKTEVTGLKNQIAKLKKDLEKAQKLAVPAKGKKKAA